MVDGFEKILISLKRDIKKELANGFLVVDKYNMEIPEEREVVVFRRKMCMGDPDNGVAPCMWYDALRDECKDCGCIIELKTQTITERSANLGNFKEIMEGGKIVKTHCPHARWMDKDVANYYRGLEGRELID